MGIKVYVLLTDESPPNNVVSIHQLLEPVVRASEPPGTAASQHPTAERPSVLRSAGSVPKTSHASGFSPRVNVGQHSLLQLRERHRPDALDVAVGSYGSLELLLGVITKDF